MSGITLKESDPADIPTPDTNKNTIFIDSTAIPPAPSYKDDSGAVTTLRGSVGVTGSQGPMGPVMILSDGLDGEPGLPGPQGPAGAAGAGSGDWDATITKTVNDTVTNSATLTNDSELVTAALVNGASYLIEFVIIYSGTSAAADYKWLFTFASAANADSCGWYNIRNASLSAVIAAIIGVANSWPNAGVATGTDAAGASNKYIFRGSFNFVSNGVTPVQFQFAQNTLTAAQSVTTYAGSYIRIKRLA